MDYLQGDKPETCEKIGQEIECYGLRGILWDEC